MPTPRPVFDGINIIVRDMDASVVFYRRLGLEIADTEPQWQSSHRNVVNTGIDFDLDSTEFARQWNEGWRQPSPGGGCVIGFRVESRAGVDALYNELTGAGYRGQQAPYDAFWGSRYAVVEDPDGNAVGLMSPRDPAFRSPASA